MSGAAQGRSLRSFLLAGIIGPLALFIVLGAIHLYLRALGASNAAYDRMLVTTAYSIGDRVVLEDGRLRADVTYAMVEVYEADYSTRLIYRISDRQGRYIAGDRDLPAYAGEAPWPATPALLKVYEGRYGSAPVRIAAVAQPSSPHRAEDDVVIQIAEPLAFREDAAHAILWGTVLPQTLLLLAVAIVTWLVVGRGLRPLESLRAQLAAREEDDLSPLSAPQAPRELQPMVGALNEHMRRLLRTVDLQQRFVANASHQLRTPLAVLKMQLQSGLRGDVEPELALREMTSTVDRATNLANQLLSLARIEQMRASVTRERCDLAQIARDVAIDLSPLVSDKNLDFELDAVGTWIDGRDWMVAEMVSNLLHNAIRHTPPASRLGIRVAALHDGWELCVWDSGPGIAEQQEMRVFEPFTGCHSSQGGGLGLTICAEIADAIGATLALCNRKDAAGDAIAGLDATVRFSADGVRAA